MHAGVMVAIEGTNIVITVGSDDLWVDPLGQLIIVDYKATSKYEDTLDDDWQIG